MATNKQALLIKILGSLSSRFRSLRIQSGKTLRQISLEIELIYYVKISHSILGKLERGDIAISLDKFVALCDYYCISPNELLNIDTTSSTEENGSDLEMFHYLLRNSSGRAILKMVYAIAQDPNQKDNFYHLMQNLSKLLSTNPKSHLLRAANPDKNQTT